MIRKCLRFLVSGVMLWPLTVSYAEDIDLFMGLPTSAIEKPNVLFILDNTANWSRTGTDGRPKYASEIEALAAVFRSVPTDRLNVGLMMFTETGGGNSGDDGAYVRAAIRAMTESNKELYAQGIEELDQNADKSNGGKVSMAMAEAYHYFAGLETLGGNNKAKSDYSNNRETRSRTWGAIHKLEGNALATKSSDTYQSPLTAGCVKNYIIYISNGPAQDSNSDLRRAGRALAALGTASAVELIPLSPSGSQDILADEWARWMRKESTEAVSVFTLDVDRDTSGQAPGWTALLQSMAAQSDGKYYDVASSATDITKAIQDALSSILAVNSVFASVALPASTNTQSTFLNQVYIGLFRPDGNALPRWPGNLKQYKLGYVESAGVRELKVVDAEGVPVVDSGTGFIRECARSYWTPDFADNYWSFMGAAALGECQVIGSSPYSNSPDGPVVEKGGQGYLARSRSNPLSRQVYTCNPVMSSCTSLDNLNLSTPYLTPASLGLVLSEDRDKAIRWAIGYDEGDEDGDGIYNEVRASVHGDIVHSQPVAIDYGNGDPDDPRVVVYYGGNDGMLRAINGNRSTTHSSTPAGGEFWSFMPPEFYDDIVRLGLNDTVIKYPATGATAGSYGEPKNYGMDGPLSTYMSTSEGVTSRYLYATMRRGGRSIYGFDVSTVTAPRLMWRLGCPNLDDDASCVSGFEKIGQTWSRASVAQVRGRDNPVLIMGGGYDDCEDFDDNSTRNHNCAASDKGDVIYLIDGVSGALLKTIDSDSQGNDLPRGFAANITIVPESDDDPSIVFAYAADTGGNLYRLHAGTRDAPKEINTADPSTWVLTRIAALGCGDRATSTCTNPRKFLFAPDVVRAPGNDKLTILIGSGDREKSLYDYGAAGAVSNYYYSVVDQPLNAEWFDDSNPKRCFADIMCPARLTTMDMAGTVAAGAWGWKYPLRSRESVVSSSLVIADLVNFSTHIPVAPTASACDANLGEATTYNIGFDDAEGDKTTLTAGGLAPTPVAGKVVLDDGTIVPFCIGCGGENSAIGSKEISASAGWTQPVSRVSWEVSE